MYKVIKQISVPKRTYNLKTHITVSKSGQIFFSPEIAEQIKAHGDTYDVLLVENAGGQRLYAISPNTEGGHIAAMTQKNLYKTNATNLAKTILRYYNLEFILTSDEIKSHKFDVDIQDNMIILLPPKKFGE